MPMLLSRREEIRALRLARSQPASAGELLELIEEIKERTVDTALADERVRNRMAGGRYRVVAADYREDKPAAGEQTPRRLAEVGIYDYKADVLVVVVVDLHQGTVLGIEERPGVQPPVSDEELAEAYKILEERRPNPVSIRAMRSVAFPTPRYTLRSDRAKHRCVTLYFDSGHEPASTAGTGQITIDLSAEAVVPEQEILSGPEIANTR